MTDEPQSLIPEAEIQRRPPVKRTWKKCRWCDERRDLPDLDEDGLCDFCNDSHAACSRCKKIFSHGELGENSAYTEGNWPACDECLKPEEFWRKKEAEDS